MDFEKISQIQDIELFQNINLEKYTTIKLANTGTIAICKSLSALKEMLLIVKEEKFHIVGWGANQVLLDVENTLFIKLNLPFDKTIFSEVKDQYYLPASVALNTLTSHAQKFGLKGWEVFTGIPASFGGAIYMNAGTALGEIGDLIESVDILKTSGEVYNYKCNEQSFSYRKNNFVGPGEIIVGATIKHLGQDDEIKTKIKDYLEYRKSTQPLATKNCGSVFKNHPLGLRAGRTIDTIGLKDFGYPELKVSKAHANFIENCGQASAKQFKSLVDCLKIDIERYSGHKFELEVKVY